MGSIRNGAFLMGSGRIFSLPPRRRGLFGGMREFRAATFLTNGRAARARSAREEPGS
jgi:hypothetical protein